MGFSTPLSGLKAAGVNLQVTGNNIANSQTTGFKESRAEFADVYASNMNMGNASKTQPGNGVVVADVAQQFNSGAINVTNNALDMAIKGDGFFVLAEQVNFKDLNDLNAVGTVATPIAYTRSGEFKLDKNGTIVNNQGKYLLAYPPVGGVGESNDKFSVGAFKPVTLDSAHGAPKPTANIDLKINLDSSKPPPTVAVFDRNDSKSYNYSTAVNVYDSEGNVHEIATYYVKDAAPATNSWQMYLFADGYGITPGTPGTPPGPATVGAQLTPPLKGGATGAGIPITFTTSGLLDTVNGSTAITGNPPGLSKFDVGAIDTKLLLDPVGTNDQVKPLSFDIDLSGSTQFAAKDSVNALKQDGLPAGNLTGIDVDNEGVIFAHYSNGDHKALGQVALARFNSPQSLAKIGDTTWAASSGAGEPIYGQAGSNNFGDVNGSALEGSNVDLSEQLVKLIIAQQTYQANAQAITTEKSLLETILRA